MWCCRLVYNDVDALNQLASFNQGSGAHTQSFSYNSLGNRESVTTDASTQTYGSNDQNEITSVSGATTPTYDANGNMTTDETGKEYVYDAWNRLVAVKNSSGTTLKTYGYDGLNRRVSETALGTTTDLYYSSQWQVLEDQVSGATTARYVWSPVYVDALVLRDRATTTPGTLNERLWVQQDANWNVTAVVNGSGAVVERYVYDPYGKATVLSASWTVLSGSAYAWQYLFQGGRVDAVSGLVYFENRDYSVTLGRWTTMDPSRYTSGEVNLYTSFSNSPVARFDYLGLKSCGPDVTNWFQKEIEQFRSEAIKFVNEMTEFYKIRSSDWFEDYNPYSNAKKAIFFKNYLERFSRLAGHLTDYKMRTKANVEPFDYSTCKDPDQNTVTICGQCIGTNQLGNFMYGIVASRMKLASQARKYGKGELNYWINDGSINRNLQIIPFQDVPWTNTGESYREEAFDAGLEYEQEVIDGKSPSICDFLKKHALTGKQFNDPSHAWEKTPCTAAHNGPNTDMNRKSCVDVGGNQK